MTKEELRAIPTLYKRIEANRQHLVYLREKATSIPSGLGGDPDRVQHSTENRAGYIYRSSDRSGEGHQGAGNRAAGDAG